MMARYDRKRKQLVLLLVFCGLLLQSSCVQHRTAEPFRPGDQVCFVGDSITHGGGYHSFIYLFNATRFPEQPLRIYNRGISGDVAGGGLRRLDWDILPVKPSVATVMLGMNDVAWGSYGLGKEGPLVEKKRQDALDRYRKDMNSLADKLIENGCRLILITPSPYDQTAQIDHENSFGVNDALGVCAGYGRDMAREKQSGLVDFYGQMNAITASRQKKDPTFTLCGNDRIHPGQMGHFVMAYLFLKAQGMPETVSRTVINASGGKVLESLNCDISNLKVSANEVRFETLEAALPFPAEGQGVKKALELVPFNQEMNREILCVKNLHKGEYELLIDEQVVGDYTAGQLAAGVNLALNVRTPMYRQALEVMEINERRHDRADKLRDLALTRHNWLPADIDDNDLELAKKLLQEKLEKRKDHREWFEGKIASYLEEKPKEKAIAAEVEQAMDEMYKKNKPGPHTFVIRRK